MASAVWANLSSAYLKKMSPRTGEAYSDAFSPELARSWSAVSQSLLCTSPRSVATPVLPSIRSNALQWQVRPRRRASYPVSGRHA